MPPRPRLPLPARRLVGGLAAAVTCLVAVAGADLPSAGAFPDSGQQSASGPGSRPDAEPAPEPRTAPAAPGEAGMPPVGERPRPRATRSRAPAPRQVHVVADGETPQSIAERHGVAPRALTRANAHVEPSALAPGAVLVVPDPAAMRPQTPDEAMAADMAVEGLIDALAAEHGVDPGLAKAVAWVESRWDQHVVSSQEAIGVMQVQPATGATVARHLGRPLDLHDLRDNVEAGVAYLAMLEERYGDVRARLAAYHQGPRAVDERGVYASSVRYAADVLALREVFAGGAARRP